MNPLESLQTATSLVADRVKASSLARRMDIITQRSLALLGRNQRRGERGVSFDRSYCVWQGHARRDCCVGSGRDRIGP